MKAEEALSDIFMEQCIGEYSGHMARIPHNPILYSICKVMCPSMRSSSDPETRKQFARMLHELADNLTEEKDFG